MLSRYLHAFVEFALFKLAVFFLACFTFLKFALCAVVNFFWRNTPYFV
jgi:hypothetical protein